LSLLRLLAPFLENRAETRAGHPDPSLRGRTYAIPFAKVWAAAAALASGGLRGWSLVEADEDRGVIRAESTTLAFRFVDDVRIEISLDENGQTRVDMMSASRVGKGDLGQNARRIRKFFRGLDRKVGAGPGTILDPTLPLFRLLVLGAVVLATACTPSGEVPPELPDTDALPMARDPEYPGRSYERHVVFLGSRGDTMVVVPWSFTSRTRAGGVDREIRGWIYREGGEGWESVFSERWESSPSRVQWRILPRGPVRLIVGGQDALEAILYQGGARSMEVASGTLMVEWSGQRGQSFRVHDATTFFSEHSVNGTLLDMSRAWASNERPGGDFVFLVSGSSLQVVCEDQTPANVEQGGEFACWGRVLFGDREWRGVRLAWNEVRAFEAARRDVPVAWEIRSPDGTLGGRIASVSQILEAGEGEGPVLPLSGLYRLTGTVLVEDREFPVEGFLKHRQR
jgi:hypothetical protein